MASKKPSTAPAITQPAFAPTLGQRLTQAYPERYLWSTADNRRGSIETSNYKNYIFGLLFLRRLSERFEQECATIHPASLRRVDGESNRPLQRSLFDTAIETGPFGV